MRKSRKLLYDPNDWVGYEPLFEKPIVFLLRTGKIDDIAKEEENLDYYFKYHFLAAKILVEHDPKVFSYLDKVFGYTLFELYPKGSGYLKQMGDPFEDQERSVKVNESIRIQELIKNIYVQNEEIYRISSIDFERLIAELLRKRGFQVELTKSTRDGGFDILALSSLNGFQNKYLVECKRYGKDRPVGVGVVRELFGVINRQQANKGIIFTSSYFSMDAKREQQGMPYLLELKDGLEVINWIKSFIEG